MEKIISGEWWRSHQSLACKGLCILRFCVMSWKGESEANIKYCLGRTVGLVQRFTTIQNFGHNWRRTDGIRVEISQDSLHWSSSTKSKSSWPKWATQRNSKDELSSCRCSMTSSGELKTMNRNVLLMPHLCLYLQRRFPEGRWSFLGLGSEKKWYSTCIDRRQGEWDRVAEVMMIKFGESGHPVFRATSPLSRGTLKSKGGGKLSIHFCADGDTIETVFRSIISVNQLSIYGAVSDFVWGIQCLSNKNGKARVGRTIWPIVRARKIFFYNHDVRMFVTLEHQSINHNRRSEGRSTTFGKPRLGPTSIDDYSSWRRSRAFWNGCLFPGTKQLE